MNGPQSTTAGGHHGNRTICDQRLCRGSRAGDACGRSRRECADLRLRLDAAWDLDHTTSSAIAKVLKEKGGLNTLVQATAGESVMIAMVGRGEADFGMANTPEIGIDGSRPATDSRTCA